MTKFGKIWGMTKPLYMGPSVEVHEIEVNEGGTCSLHCHQTKFNGFYVIEGELVIETHKNVYELVDSTVLKAGDFTVCKPGEYHRFVAKSKVKALEVYFTELNHNDIVRKNVGYIDESK